MTSLSIPSGQPVASSAAEMVAKQALARANAMVAQDQANHSPSCVAVDQKLVDKAQQQLAAAQTASAQQSATQPVGPLGANLNILS